MKKKMINLFFYWIKERHNIFLKKEAGEPRPWTGDPILHEYKFTNPYRENDRVTRELNKRISRKDSPVKVYTKIVIFRMFNWPETYDVLSGNGLVEKWDTRKAINILRKYKSDGNKVFTGAYIITNNGLKEDKISLVCKAIGQMLKNTEANVEFIKKSKSLERSAKYLSQFPMVGDFIAYELVTDMRHTSLLNRAIDIYTWANPGPGAKRGIHRIMFETARGALPAGEKVDYQWAMQYLMEMCQSNFNQFMEMRDVEHSLCEFDKYMRVKNGEGKPRSKYR